MNMPERVQRSLQGSGAVAQGDALQFLRDAMVQLATYDDGVMGRDDYAAYMALAACGRLIVAAQIAWQCSENDTGAARPQENALRTHAAAALTLCLSLLCAMQAQAPDATAQDAPNTAHWLTEELYLWRGLCALHGWDAESMIDAACIAVEVRP